MKYSNLVFSSLILLCQCGSSASSNDPPVEPEPTLPGSTWMSYLINTANGIVLRFHIAFVDANQLSYLHETIFPSNGPSLQGCVLKLDRTGTWSKAGERLTFIAKKAKVSRKSCVNPLDDQAEVATDVNEKITMDIAFSGPKAMIAGDALDQTRDDTVSILGTWTQPIANEFSGVKTTVQHVFIGTTWSMTMVNKYPADHASFAGCTQTITANKGKYSTSNTVEGLLHAIYDNEETVNHFEGCTNASINGQNSDNKAKNSRAGVSLIGDHHAIFGYWYLKQ